MTRRERMTLLLAIVVARLAYFVSWTFGLGEGTNLPGKIALRLFPGLLKILVPRYRQGWILVTGTNGKTTTTKILAEFLRDLGFKVNTNSKGANLLSGIVTSILLGPVHPGAEFGADYAVFEIDEGVLVKFLPLLRPRMLIVTNFSRDQLDRYGEIDSYVEKIIALLREADFPCRLVLNGNDPHSIRIGAALRPEDRFYFGFKEDAAAPGGGMLLVEKEIGDVGLAPPPLDLWCAEVELDRLRGGRFRLGCGDSFCCQAETGLPGAFNVLNAAAALAAGLLLGGDLPRMLEVLREIRPGYGRGEHFLYRGSSVWLFLVKNPVGFNHVIRLLGQAEEERRILLLLNDRVADGRDVSWIWDVSLEDLWKTKGIKEVVASGTRAGDMALRVKYSDPHGIPVRADYSPRRAFRRLAARLEPGESLVVLANYTAMVEFRPYLSRISKTPGLRQV